MPNKIYRRQTCDCSRLATVWNGMTWICEPCHVAEKRMAYRILVERRRERSQQVQRFGEIYRLRLQFDDFNHGMPRPKFT